LVLLGNPNPMLWKEQFKYSLPEEHSTKVITTSREICFLIKTHLPEMLERSRCKLDLKIETLMMIDSLEMTAQDLQHIISSCKTSSSNAIVITHGTDKMTHTAAAIAAAQISNKTIVLTGAMIPYAFGSSSDGFFNLGCALAYVQSLPPEVYITMQGQYFLWNEVKKNKELGYFEKI
jgi:L-asparaginase